MLTPCVWKSKRRWKHSMDGGNRVNFLGTDVNGIYLLLMFALGVSTHWLFFGIYELYEHMQTASQKGP